MKCFISQHFPFAEYTNVKYSTLRTCRPSCCFGQKLPAFHHLLSLNHSLCISLFSVWTLSPSQIPFSLPFLYFYHFLFPLLSVMLTACGISSSPCLSDPQAISRSLLHLSVSTEGLPHLRQSYRSRLTTVLQCFLSGSDICTSLKVVWPWGLQGVIPREPRMSRALSVYTNYISFQRTMLLLQRVNTEWRLPKVVFVLCFDSFMALDWINYWII